ncbi:hypothetical protein D3C86_1774120 [compost metagenome]
MLPDAQIGEALADVGLDAGLALVAVLRPIALVLLQEGVVLPRLADRLVDGGASQRVAAVGIEGQFEADLIGIAEVSRVVVLLGAEEVAREHSLQRALSHVGEEVAGAHQRCRFFRKRATVP